MPETDEPLEMIVREHRPTFLRLLWGAGPDAGATTNGNDMTQSLRASDDLAGQGAIAPRVSLDDLEAKISAENYFTAGEAAAALGQPVTQPMGLLTICVLTLTNGFTVIGQSATASAGNFDAVKGRAFARDAALRQLWPLEGYALRERVAAGDRPRR